MGDVTLCSDPTSARIGEMVSNLRKHSLPRPSAGSYECVVVGAGVVGCAIATTLAGQGRRVLVLERDLSSPERIVGELGQPAMINALRELGMESVLDGIDAISVEGYALHYGGRSAGLRYPVVEDAAGSGNGAAEARGFSFHHGNFISSMRNRMVDGTGVEVVEATVLELLREGEGTAAEKVVGVSARVRTEDGRAEEIEVRAGLTLVCDGCHSRFRVRAQTAALGDAAAAPTVRVKSHFVGAILKDAVLPYDKYGNVCLIKPSPVLFYQIGTRDTRVLVDVPGEKLPPRPELVKYLTDHVAPQLPESLRAPYLDAISDPSELRSMPCQSMHAFDVRTPGVFLIGDSLNMRNPLTGGGMTVALRDVVLIRDLWAGIKDLSDHAAVEKARGKFLSARRGRVSTVNVLANALYDVFSVEKQDFDQLREACFLYLKAGGIWSSGPVLFLSGLNTSPLFLATHFFAVAAYGTYRVCTPIPTPRKVVTAASLFVEAAGIMLPLLAREGITPLSTLGRLWYGM